MSAKKSPPHKTQVAATVDGMVHRSPTPVIHAEQRFEGPLPHPELLKQYEEVVPGCAERIVKMAETEQASRLELSKSDSRQKEKLIDIAKNESEASTQSFKRGQLIGLGITVLCVILAFCCAKMGMSGWIVAAFLGVPTASFISSFMYRRPKKDEQK